MIKQTVFYLVTLRIRETILVNVHKKEKKKIKNILIYVDYKYI